MSGTNGNGNGGLGGGMSFRPPPRPSLRGQGGSMGRKSGAAALSAASSSGAAGSPPLPSPKELAAAAPNTSAAPADDSIGAGDAAGTGTSPRLPGADLTNLFNGSVNATNTASTNASKIPTHRRTTSNASAASSAAHSLSHSQAHAPALYGGDGKPRRPSAAQNPQQQQRQDVPLRSSSVSARAAAYEQVIAGAGVASASSRQRAPSTASVASAASSAASSVYESSSVLSHGLQHGAQHGAQPQGVVRAAQQHQQQHLPPASSSPAPRAVSAARSVSGASILTASGAGVGVGALPTAVALHGPASASATAAACRAALEELRARTEDQAHSAGMLGHGILHQQTVVQGLLDELAELDEQQADASAASAAGTGASAHAEAARALRERIDDELADLARRREDLYREVWRVSGGAALPASAGAAAAADASFASTASHSQSINAFSAPPAVLNFSFLAQDPASAGASKRDSVGSLSGILGGGVGGASSARQADRRSRNAAAGGSGGGGKMDDAFVRQIQESLLGEVRRLQAENKELAQLLAQREGEHTAQVEELAAKHALEEQKLKGMVRDQELLKAEAYDAELARQTAEEELHNIRTTLTKTASDNQRLERELLSTKEKVETQKQLLDEQSDAFTQAQARRDREIAELKKDKIALRRDHSELQGELDKVRAEHNNRRLYPRSVSNSLAFADRSIDEDDEEGELDADGKPVRRRVTLGGGAHDAALLSPGAEASSPLHLLGARNAELDDLRAKLAVAQRKAGKDAADRRKQREQIAQLKALLDKAGVRAARDTLGSDVETSDEENEDDWRDDADQPEHSPSKDAKRARKNQQRAARGANAARLPQLGRRLGLAAVSRDAVTDIADDEFVDAEQDHEQDDAEHENEHDRDSSALDHGPAFEDASTSQLPEQDGVLAGADAQADPSRGSVLHDESADEPVRRAARGRKSANFSSNRDSFIAESTPEPLGAELDLGAAEMHAQPQRELTETGVMTEPLEALLQPVLARKDQEHAAVLAAQADAHAKVLAARHDEHSKALAARSEEHAKSLAASLAEQGALHSAALAEYGTRHKAALEKALADKDAEHNSLLADSLDQKAHEHRNALAALAGKHSEQLEQKQAAHDAALAERDVQHQATLSQALAEKAKAHDAALADARLRHANALAEQVAASSSALAAAEAAHKALLNDAKKQHVQELQTLMEQHASELNQKDAEHEDHVQDVHASHSKYMAQRDAAYNTAITERDTAIREAHEHVQRLTDEVNSLREQLAAALRDVEANKAAHVAAGERITGVEKELLAVTALKEALETQKADLESSKAALANELAEKERQIQLAEEKAEEKFEDANSELHSSVNPHSVPPPPQRETHDEGVQTDEVLAKPPSPLEVAFRPESALTTRSQLVPAGSNTSIGGVTVLGGFGKTNGRESVNTFGGARDTEATPTPTMYTVGDILGRDANAESTNAPIDKSQPPVMTLPPPPVLPPPPGIPPKRSQPPIFQTAPPRPTSPPPPELLQRLSTRSTLQVPNSRQSARNANNPPPPPPSSYIPPSTSAMRASGTRSRGSSHDGALLANGQAAAADDSSMKSGRRSIGSRRSTRPHGRRGSVNSFASDVTSEASHRMSISSQISEEEGDRTFTAKRNGGVPAEGVDPAVINAITQTMIGSYLYKYTRKSMGRAGHSDKRHQRYFWVHPYTRMLYWTVTDPGGAGVTEGKSKSACIESVEVVEDPNPSPPGLFHLSILVRTAAREMKITAPNRERHDVWLSALGYLVKGTQVDAATKTATTRGLRGSASMNRLGLKRAADASVTEFGGVTTRTRGGSISGTSILNGSVSKRKGIPARDYLKQQEAAAAEPTSTLASRRARLTDMFGSGDDAAPQAFSAAQADPRLQTAEQMLEEDHNDSWDGLDNVRACCDGKHDVGSLAHRGHHHHQSRPSSRLHKRWSSGGGGLVDAIPRATSPVPQVSLTLPRESFERSLRASGDNTRPRLF